MPRIERLSYCAVVLPLAQPIAFATAGTAQRCFGLLRLHDSDGGCGLAYAYLGPTPLSLVGRAIEELLAPIALGQDADDIEPLWDRMSMATQLHGRAGSVMRAMSLIDIALWDLRARRLGQPLHRALGSADGCNAVDAYAAGGYYGPGKGVRELVSEVAELRDLGFRSIKIKTGKFSPEVEGQRVEAARAELGPEIDLMLDANNAWADVATALDYLERLRPSNPYWIEEPLVEDDVNDLLRLRDASGIRIAAGENEANPLRFRHYLQAGAAAIIQPDANTCGGITPWMRIARSAAAYPVLVCPHAYHNLHIQLLAAIGPQPGKLEFMPGERVMNFGRLIDKELDFAEGRVFLPATPGIGFDFVDAAVKAHAVRAAGQPGDWVEWV